MIFDELDNELTLGCTVIYGAPDPADLADARATLAEIGEEDIFENEEGRVVGRIIPLSFVFPNGDVERILARKHDTDRYVAGDVILETS